MTGRTDPQTLTRLRAATPKVLDSEYRDLTKRTATTVLMSAALIWFDFPAAAVLMIVTALVYELALLLAIYTTPNAAAEITPLRAKVILALVLYSTAVYCLPALFLASHGSVPGVILAVIWIFGYSVHLTSAFVTIPVYVRAVSLPLVLFAAAVLLIAMQTRHFDGTTAQWLATLAVLPVFFSGLLDAHAKQNQTYSQLQRTQSESATRLRELEFLNRHDGLTGVLNRAAFDQALALKLKHRTDHAPLAVLLFDLDGFKPINDTYGHGAGDAVLKASARRLADHIGPAGLVARLGGDEFIVALPNLPDAETAVALGAEMARRLARPIPWQDTALTVGVSAGVAICDPINETVEAVCGRADQAMYQAKAAKDGTVVLYDPAQFAPRLTLDDRNRLADAIRTGRIRPYYQPKVNLATGQVTGFEALARWVRDTGRVLPPSDFLGDIMELGLESEFSYHMARQVLSNVTRLLNLGLDPGQVSLNLTESTLATNSVREDLEWLMGEHPEAVPHLTLEVTETVFTARGAALAKAAVERLSERGARISLDDFGTGYASLKHLRELPFDELKIDGRFVAELGEDPVADVIVKGAMTIARGLDLMVVAEGVETETQAQRLRALSCSQAQGYLFGKAVPLNDVADLLSNPTRETA